MSNDCVPFIAPLGAITNISGEFANLSLAVGSKLNSADRTGFYRDATHLYVVVDGVLVAVFSNNGDLKASTVSVEGVNNSVIHTVSGLGTVNRTAVLPNKSGTIAFIDDIGITQVPGTTTGSVLYWNGTTWIETTDLVVSSGNITVTNAVATKGVAFNPVATNPGGATTLWYNSADSKLYLGATELSVGRGSWSGLQYQVAVGDIGGVLSGYNNFVYNPITTILTTSRVTPDDINYQNLVLTDTNSLYNSVISNGVINFTFTIDTSITGTDFKVNNAAYLNFDSTKITTYKQLVSTVTTGTAPFTVLSTTLVTNLNADLLDGQHGSYYLDYNNLTNIPSTFTPSAHTLDSHSNVTITSNTSGEILKWNGSFWINNTLAEAGIAAVSHTHAINDVTGLQTALDGKSDVGHTHDDRYYTETEVNTLLTGKANTVHTHAISDVTGLQTALDNKVDDSEKGAALGVATLDGAGKVPTSQLPDSLLGQVEYQGNWNASTNTPTLPVASTVKGHYYITTVAGVYSTVDYNVGDWIISDGVNWTKVDNTDAVPSVFGRTGAITATSGDYTASLITNVPAGNVAAITVQAAINELDSEKASTVHTHAINDVTGLQTALDGKSDVGHTHDDRYYTETEVNTLLTGKVDTTAYTASDVLAKLITVDGAGSGLDADLLDGQSGAYYLAWANLTGVPSTFAPSAHTLDSHSNVTITANSAGEILKWSGTAWINNTLAEAGIQPLDSTLTALAAYNTNGILTQTSADTFVGRTITGTTNQVTVTNGSGVSGNPTLSLPQNIHTAATPTFTSLTLSQTTGTAPLTISSTTLVTNLNADLLDGQHGSYYLAWANLTGVPSTFTPSAHTLDSHSNVTITSNSAGELLVWNGTAWINNTLAEAGIAATSHNHTLDSLSNVTITSNSAGEILKWSGTAWINNTLAEAGIQPLDSTLTSLASYNTNGLLTQTAADTFVGRTITGTTNQVTVTNGNGVSGNPTLSLPQNIHTAATPTFTSLTLSQITGTAPLTVSSTTVVTNLNADLLDGQHGSYYAAASSLGSYVLKAGDTMSGDLTTSGIFTDRRKLFQTNSFDAVNTQYFHIATLGDYTLIGQWDGIQVRGNIGFPAYINVDFTWSNRNTANSTITGTVPKHINSYFQVYREVDNSHKLYLVIAANAFQCINLEVFKGIMPGTGFGTFAGQTTTPTGTLTLSTLTDVVVDYVNRISTDYGDNANPGIIVGDSQYGLYSGGGNLYVKSSSAKRVIFLDGSSNTFCSIEDTYMTLPGDRYLDIGPNSTYSETLRVGGNGHTAVGAQICTTNGNIHIDPKSGSFSTYLNYYSGTGGTVFGNGASSTVGSVSSGGVATFVRFVSTVSTGTAPLSVTSTTLCANLNADLLDGQHGSYYLAWANLTGVPSTFTPSAHTLDSHSNVTITANTAGELLVWNGSAWINNTLAEAGIAATSHNHTLDSLSNTTITSNTNGEILKWNGSAWINNTLAEAGIAATSHNHTLDSLSNTTITANSAGELLVWNGSAWVNNTLAEAGIQPLDSTLTALAAYNTNGILTQTAADTFVGRTITGTTNQVTVTNGSGVSGNPTLSLPQNIHTAATPTFTSLTLSQTTGTTPLTVSSTTLVTNLNADLLDGQHGSYYLDAGNLTGTIADARLSSNVLLLNTPKTWTSTGTNALSFQSQDIMETASGDQASLEVYQDTAGADAFMQFHVASDFAAYFGLKGDINDFAVGGWSMGANYYRVWHAGNDGSGSTLDADLLDGQHGSYYLDWANLTGVPSTFTPSAHTLDSHSNVTITANSAGELLVWNGSAWVNNTLAEAGIQPLDSTLTSLASYNTNGILTQTAADTFVGRTITGTTNQVTVTNGNGVSGNPTLSLPQNIHTAATPTFTRLTLSQATGTAPLTVSSTTVVTNLNADLLDGQHGSYYLDAGNLTGTIPNSVTDAAGRYISRVSFQPTVIGWYRILSGSTGVAYGKYQIYSNYNNAVDHVIFEVVTNLYSGIPSIRILYNSYAGGSNISSIRIGNDGGANFYIDVYFSSVTGSSANCARTDYIEGYIPDALLVPSPVSGAVAPSTVRYFPLTNQGTVVERIIVTDKSVSDTSGRYNAHVAIDSTDGALDIISDTTGTWGSRLTLSEKSGTAFANTWGILRQTGSTALAITYGTNNDAAVNSIHAVGNTSKNWAFGDSVIFDSSSWYASVFGQSGTNKAIIGYCKSSTNCVTVAGHSTNLDAWADIGIHGNTNVFIRMQEATAATFSSNGLLLNSGSLTLGTGGNYAAGSVYSDSNWGMIFRAKQASPTLADFRWCDSSDNELMRISSNVLRKINNVPAISNNSYNDGHIELRTTDNSLPRIGFHRAGTDAVALYYNGGSELRIRGHLGTDAKIWTEANDGASSGLDADLLDGQHGSYYAPLSNVIRTDKSTPDGAWTAGHDGVGKYHLTFSYAGASNVDGMYYDDATNSFYFIADTTAYATGNAGLYAGYLNLSVTTGERITLGNNTSTSTASPVSIDMGGTFSNAAGTNLKLKLYDDGTDIYGLGVSAAQLDYTVPTGKSHVWYIGGTERARISSTNLQLSASSTDEGGELVLKGGTTGYADWTIDSYQDELRIFCNVATQRYVNFFNTSGGQNVNMYVDGTFTADSTIASPSWRMKRTDSGSEGGQIDFERASDAAISWSVDVNGSTSNPDLRIIRNSATVPMSMGVLSATDSEEVVRINETLSTQSVKRAYETVTSSAGTKTLSLHNNYLLIVTGTTTHTVALPVWTSSDAPDGKEFIIKNRSTGNVTVTMGSGNNVDGSTSSITLTTNQVLHVIYCASLNGYVKVNT